VTVGSKIPLDEIGTGYPQIISPAELAEILGRSVKTIYAWIAAGRLHGCYKKRGKHIMIYRPSAIERILTGPEWR
jgi:excisionase family DNA binding protein